MFKSEFGILSYYQQSFTGVWADVVDTVYGPLLHLASLVHQSRQKAWCQANQVQQLGL
jgi:hypothetical protein